MEFVTINSSSGSNGTTIHTKNSLSFFIDSGNYGNMPLLRRALQQHLNAVAGIKSPISTQGQLAEIASESDMELKTYAGNPLLTPYCIGLFIGILITFIAGSPVFTALCILLPIAYLFIGWRLFYFKLSGTHFIVQNHLWFWYKKVYPVVDINEFIYEASTRGTSSGIRIILNDFESLGWQADSLRNKDWKNFKKHIHVLKVRFRNEAFI